MNARTEAWLSVVGHLITAAGIIIGVCQFNRQQNLSETIEFKRSYWNKKLETLTKIGMITGDLISTKDNKELFAKASHEFKSLYWGGIILFDDPTIESKMKDLKKEIDDNLNQAKDLTQPFRLEEKGDAVVNACKNEIKNLYEKLSDE